jgi:hypothetical protein
MVLCPCVGVSLGEIVMANTEKREMEWWAGEEEVAKEEVFIFFIGSR